jgi:hypothetical protein
LSLSRAFALDDLPRKVKIRATCDSSAVTRVIAERSSKSITRRIQGQTDCSLMKRSDASDRSALSKWWKARRRLSPPLPTAQFCFTEDVTVAKKKAAKKAPKKAAKKAKKKASRKAPASRKA